MTTRRFAAALVAALLVAAAPAARAQSSGHYRDFGDPGGFLNIVPPGQDGVLNGPEAIQAQAGTYPPHVIDQLSMYGDLVYNTPGLTEDRLLEFYKDASFGAPDDDIDRVYSPTANVTVVRDASFGVPHIFGETRYATMFAQGYTAAEDRLFLMDILRHVGRARMSEFLGASPGDQHMDREQLAIAPYREEDLTAQIEAIRDSGPEGLAGYQDLVAYADGVNQYIDEALADASKLPAEYPALQQVPQPWKVEDAVAIASLVGGVFGKGGGGELTNFCGLKAMTTALGSAVTARAVFDDLHFANDAEAPTTAPGTFPYLTDLGPVNPAAHPDIDCATLVPIDTSGPPLQDLLDAISGASPPLAVPGFTSNALLVAAEHTQAGRPIAVFGPQTGYFMPQLLVEKDVHGPNIDARGVAFAGTDLFVQLGRGRNYAFSATSAGADNVDQFVLELCEPGGGTPTVQSMGYLHDGVCKPIETYQHTQVAKPSAGGPPGVQESGAQCANAADDDGDGFVNDGCPPVGLPELPIFCTNANDDDADLAVNDGCPPIAGTDIVLSWRVDRTPDYGPLVARGTLVNGTPIAIATLRSTYRHELDSARGFIRVNDPEFMTDGYDSFRQAMGGGVDYTFNWFFVNATDIGYQHSCKCPQRAAGVDPVLPAWGTGPWDWQGFIPLASQPFAQNPPAGYLSSWNNKQAPGFTASDREFGYGPVFRSQMLDVRIEAAIGAGPIDRADLVDAMEDAGTVDLRGQEVLPYLLQVLGTTAPGGADPRAQNMRDRLAAWVTTATHRRDRDHSGAYDDPQAPAIMDAWWPRLVHAMFDATSGNAIDNLHLTLDDENRRNHVGSAFQGAVYGQVQKDLRQILGLAVVDPWSRTYCGGGVLAACRTALWDAMSDAAADLQAEFSSPNVADWQRQVADEDVRHTAGGVTNVPAIHWINRPTFQQVVQVVAGDHYKCYRGKGRGGFTPPLVTLTDRFGTRSATAFRTDAVCNPADKSGEGITDATAHLACYRVKPSAFAGTVGTANQFGAQSVALGKLRTLCVPSETDGVASALGIDHYQCYRARSGAPAFTPRTLTLADAFETKSTVVRKLDTVCTPVDKNGEGIRDQSTGLACYRIKDVAGQARFGARDVAVANQFGNETVRVMRARTLCVPSSLE
ncbi:MAG TPA: penicillin acylase family protein [Candidatus Binatia bacterium]|nr:penicillin acylase family protein [Candidatus Binatia bacterium]